MLVMRKIALTVAILLSIAFTVASAASAATKHRRPAHPPPNNAAALKRSAICNATAFRRIRCTLSDAAG
jgi:hypothetical protein